MQCFYSYDPQLDLYALTVTEADGQQWAMVLDPAEFEALVARVANSPWVATPLDLEVVALRDLLYRVIGRDPDDC